MRIKLEALVKRAGQQMLSENGWSVEQKDGIGNYVTQMDQQLHEQLRK